VTSFGLPDGIVKAIVDELKSRDQVKRAVLFGSRARGDFRDRSDIDLAIECDGPMPTGLRTALDRAARIYKIDIVDMYALQDERLRRDIDREGVGIYRKSRS